MKDINLNIDEEFWQDFVQESFEHIEDIESNVLTLEHEPDNQDIINSMFRAFHTVKGLSGFVEHVVIQEVAHKTETLMDYCRKGETKVTKDIVDIILKSSDYIKALSANINAWRDEALIEQISAHLDKLDAFAEEIEKTLTGGGAPVSASAPETVEAPNAEAPQEIAEVVEGSPESFAPEVVETAQTVSVEEEEFVPIEREVDADAFMSEDFSVLVKEEPEVQDEVDAKVELEAENALASVEVQEESPVAENEEKIEEETVASDNPLRKDPKDVEAFFTQGAPTPPPPPPVVEKKQIQPEPQKGKPASNEEFMRVPNSRIDYLVDTIGELIISQSLVKDYVASHYSHDNQFVKNLDALSRVTRELQDVSTFLRSISLKSTFQKISRIARDTIAELNKDIEFITSGESTEIDRVVADKLLEPLVHLIKNAISHGVEPNPDDRVAHGKRAKAKVELNAYNKRGKIYIEIIDDGRGINTEIVYKKAIEKGCIDPERKYTEDEIKEFILLPGFSTAEKVDNISGRGVGMDVVKTQILKLGGKVSIKSELNIGSTFTLEVPINHSIMNGIIIDIQGQDFILPTVNVKEIMQPTEEQWIYSNKERKMINVRDAIIPIVPPEIFGDAEQGNKLPLVALIEMDHELRALPISGVVDRQELVIKPVGDEFANLKFLSGMSILGNGKVSLILDVSYLFQVSNSNLRSSNNVRV